MNVQRSLPYNPFVAGVINIRSRGGAPRVPNRTGGVAAAGAQVFPGFRP
jgi:hypothetical protein